MSPSMATIITAQYPPHCAPLVTPNHTRQRKGITGRTIAAAISKEFLRPMPRYSIQATIGTVMPTAMANRAWVGYWVVTSSHDLSPTMEIKMAPVAIIPPPSPRPSPGSVARSVTGVACGGSLARSPDPGRDRDPRPDRDRRCVFGTSNHPLLFSPLCAAVPVLGRDLARCLLPGQCLRVLSTPLP